MGTLKKNKYHQLERVQRRAASIVTNRHRNTSSVGEMLEKLDWPSLEERRLTARHAMLFKILNKSVAVTCTDLKPAVARNRQSNTVHSRQLNRLTSTKDNRFQSFFPHTVRKWNSLSEDTVSAPTADSFRVKLSYSY